MAVQTQRIPLPTGEKRLLETIAMALRLSQLLELKVTPTGIEVRRGVGEDEPAVPETLLEVARGVDPPAADVDLLLRQLDIESLPFDPGRHQLTTLVEMTARVRARQLFCSAWYVAEGDDLDRFLAQPEGTLSAELLGLPVHYVPEDQLPQGKLLLVGSSTRHSIDAAYGVLADIGG